MLVGEIERYGVSIAAIQETKWFGSDVWPVSGNFVFLHSGRPIPSDGEQAISTNEGVGILLNNSHKNPEYQSWVSSQERGERQ